jgi:hypothetical protein
MEIMRTEHDLGNPNKIYLAVPIDDDMDLEGMRFVAEPAKKLMETFGRMPGGGTLVNFIPIERLNKRFWRDHWRVIIGGKDGETNLLKDGA